MKILNPEYIEAVKERVNESPYFSLISMELKELGLGEARLEIMVQPKHLQPFGQVHGGVYSSVMDAAAFWAVYPQIDEGLGLTTVELKLNYLSPASEGVFVALGKVIKVGRTLCLGEASVEDEKGNLLAYGTETMMILERPFSGGPNLPPKFL